MMREKNTGIVRGIDNMGRVVLPKELRRSLGLEADSKVEIFAQDGAIVMRKYAPPLACVFCGRVDAGAYLYEDKVICPACRARIAALTVPIGEMGGPDSLS